MTPDEVEQERMKARLVVEEQQRLKRRKDTIGWLGLLVLVLLVSQCMREIGKFGDQRSVGAPEPSSVTRNLGPAATQLIQVGSMSSWIAASQEVRRDAAQQIASALGHTTIEASSQMQTCLDDSYSDATSDRPVSEMAAACALMLGWNRRPPQNE